MCMAPGGYLSTALRLNPESQALAFSLPISSGGHRVFLPHDHRVETRFIDITMLATDMGVAEIPEDHADYGKFLPQQFSPASQFDLIICDGQVLRTHERASYREMREASRLVFTQLALGLEHLRPGGTMIVLLHKVESWNTVTILRRFRHFSSVRVFKPRTGHAKRSSFYMIATNTQSQHEDAIAAVRRWKSIWKAATFGSDEEYRTTLSANEPIVEEMLGEFGAELAQLGREAWKVQADALAKASFIKNSRAGRAATGGSWRN